MPKRKQAGVMPGLSFGLGVWSLSFMRGGVFCCCICGAMFVDLGVLGLLGGVCKIQTLHDHYKKLYIVGRICNPEKRYPYMDENTILVV